MVAGGVPTIVVQLCSKLFAFVIPLSLLINSWQTGELQQEQNTIDRYITCSNEGNTNMETLWVHLVCTVEILLFIHVSFFSIDFY